MKELEAFKLIENYLNGQLQGDALLDFEHQLETDPVMAEYFKQYKEVTSTLGFYNNRKALKQKLNAIHADLEENQAPALSPFGNKEKRKFFWNQHYATIAVAASVAILTVFGTLLSVDLWRSMGKQQAARYSALRREVENIKSSQRAIIRDITGSLANPSKEEVNPGNFTGTGFVISPDGYLVTSYHVINGADSVFIENRVGKRYKVKSIFRDKAHDLAILKIEDKEFTSFGTLPYAFKSGDSDLGEKVYTLGYPREDMVFGEGSLSSRSGFEGDTTSYQISIPVNPGNSGGPLMDNQGNLIGVISGKQLDLQGAAFAVKSAYLKQLVEQLSSDSLDAPIKLSKKNSLAGTSRTNQLKKIEDYVFVVKVYNN
ncbi:S1C family serine protease [Adhaeribacter aquaticus]|uniref:S1C family serine protease n=1 Tax=Adhaeribacter aquaticus TaxID=299567 RepID=UPI00040D087D|nr:serine protease [Adhaeribacter aquaticus]